LPDALIGSSDVGNRGSTALHDGGNFRLSSSIPERFLPDLLLDRFGRQLNPGWQGFYPLQKPSRLFIPSYALHSLATASVKRIDLHFQVLNQASMVPSGQAGVSGR
jgi:hypothetical protein